MDLLVDLKHDVFTLCHLMAGWRASRCSLSVQVQALQSIAAMRKI